MRLDRFVVRDHRSVWGEPLEVRLATDVTAVVGPNRSGKSNVVRALASALDPAVAVDLDRDRPVRRPAAVPEVALEFRDRRPAGSVGGADARVRVVVTWAGPDERTVTVAPEEATGRLPLGAGRVVYCPADATLDVLLARHADQLGEPDQVVASLRRQLDRLVPGVRDVLLDDGRLVVRDTEGFALSVASGVRAAGAIGIARHLADQGVQLACTILEEPEAWLHPAAQEAVREALRELAVASDAPVVVTTESPFVTPRARGSRVVAVAKDARGATRFVGAAEGDEPQAALLGGLFRDAGLGAVLDRTTRLGPGVDAVLVVEGGTDEAYLRAAADVLDRSAELEGIAVVPAGGAMAAALQAIVLRAESDLPLLVLLDNDDPGRRAKDTLTSRFGFVNRQQVMTYAELVPDHPVGVEAEDLFDWRLVRRYVQERGRDSVRGQRILRADEWHHDLTSSAKSAFVGWLGTHLEARHAARWDALLDVVVARLHPDGAGRGPGRP